MNTGLVRGVRYVDVLIVGGGPAGTAAAIGLGGSRTVLVVEKSPVPREKTCGGLVGPRAVQLLRNIGLEVPDMVAARPRAHEHVVFWDCVSGVSESLPNSWLLNVRRAEFDKWLWDVARRHASCLAGAECVRLTRDPIRGLFTADVIARETGHETRVEAASVIVANGAGSRLCTALTGRAHRFAVTLQDVVRTTSPVESGVASAQDVFFFSAPEITPAYGWFIPKGATAYIGCAFHGCDDVQRRFERFVSIVEYALGQSFSRVARQVGRAPVLANERDAFLTVAGCEGAYFAGEAGGFLDQASGEGISYAVESGLACAEAILGKGGDRAAALMTRIGSSFDRSIFRPGSSLRLQRQFAFPAG